MRILTELFFISYFIHNRTIIIVWYCLIWFWARFHSHCIDPFFPLSIQTVKMWFLLFVFISLWFDYILLYFLLLLRIVAAVGGQIYIHHLSMMNTWNINLKSMPFRVKSTCKVKEIRRRISVLECRLSSKLKLFVVSFNTTSCVTLPPIIKLNPIAVEFLTVSFHFIYHADMKKEDMRKHEFFISSLFTLSEWKREIFRERELLWCSLIS